jgi:hypothetical protein
MIRGDNAGDKTTAGARDSSVSGTVVLWDSHGVFRPPLLEHLSIHSQFVQCLDALWLSQRLVLHVDPLEQLQHRSSCKGMDYLRLDVGLGRSRDSNLLRLDAGGDGKRPWTRLTL